MMSLKPSQEDQANNSLVLAAFKEARQEYLAFKNKVAREECEELEKIKQRIQENLDSLDFNNASVRALHKEKENLEWRIRKKCHISHSDKINYKYLMQESLELTEEDKKYFRGILLLKECAFLRKILEQRNLDPELEHGSELLDDLNFVSDIHSTLETVQTTGFNNGILATQVIPTADWLSPLRLALSGLIFLWDIKEILTTHQKPLPVGVKIGTGSIMLSLSITLALMPLAPVIVPTLVGLGLIREIYAHYDNKKNLQHEKMILERLEVLKEKAQVDTTDGSKNRVKFYEQEILRHKENIGKLESVVKSFKANFGFNLLISFASLALLFFPPTSIVGIVAGTVLLGTVLYKVAPKICSGCKKIGAWIKNKLWKEKTPITESQFEPVHAQKKEHTVAGPQPESIFSRTQKPLFLFSDPPIFTEKPVQAMQKEQDGLKKQMKIIFQESESDVIERLRIDKQAERKKTLDKDSVIEDERSHFSKILLDSTKKSDKKGIQTESEFHKAEDESKADLISKSSAPISQIDKDLTSEKVKLTELKHETKYKLDFQKEAPTSTFFQKPRADESRAYENFIDLYLSN